MERWSKVIKYCSAARCFALFVVVSFYFDIWFLQPSVSAYTHTHKTSSHKPAATSCVKYRKEIISFLRSWWDRSDRHGGGQEEVSATMDWPEARRISYRATWRHLEIESLGVSQHM